MEFPTHLSLMNPLLRELGGSGFIDEIDNKVADLEKFSDTLRDQLHNPEKSNVTELSYRLAWSRTYLKIYGLVENSSHRVWSLTPKAKAFPIIDSQAVAKHVRALPKKQSAKSSGKATDSGLVAEEEEWQEQLHTILTTKMTPDAFERLAQRLLRESGFVQVEVTGKSGDGGIDGKGIARVNDLLSFHVIFQCKRYKGTVGAKDVRDFRGAMVGRADKGLFLTTGTFSSSAVQEAKRDGAPPIDLVDGSDLILKLRDLGLGVKKTHVERVTVDADWFDNI